MKQRRLVDEPTVGPHQAQRQDYDINQNAQSRNAEVMMAGATDHRVAYQALAEATPLVFLRVYFACALP